LFLNVLYTDSPRLSESVYIVCDENVTVACGTCFVVSPELLVTAYHNLSENRSMIKNWMITKGLERAANGSLIHSGAIKVCVDGTSMCSDWALLRRVDGGRFAAGDVIEVCTDVPPPETKIKVYHCPLDLFRDGRVSAVKALSIDSRVGYYTNHKIFFQVGLFGGSSGGLIALHDGKALGMHLEGINSAKLVTEFRTERQEAKLQGQPEEVEDDVTLASDSNAQATGVLSEGIVLCKFIKLMQKL
jgi:hypothetical protein